MRHVCLILIAIALPGLLLAAEPAAFRIVSVHDGDTLTALDADNMGHGRHLARLGKVSAAVQRRSV